MRKYDLLDYLLFFGRGKENAKRATDLKQFGDSRTLRNYVHELRIEGYPILSGNCGYWYAMSNQELRECLNRLSSTISNTQKAYEALNIHHQNNYINNHLLP
ncbi:hypothetical protein RY280_23520 [Bacillus paralicheniformis]|uniref:hypothetical protein n=1 Tax=Bacillus paralicheniformis TaxID=1648923 RepID=UPI00203BBB30|nr:hypothetical protein [Bacillus paralicheniformis]MCM3425590.1 hypothetical protein [Bacillus paralicheniformis]